MNIDQDYDMGKEFIMSKEIDVLKTDAHDEKMKIDIEKQSNAMKKGYI